MWPIWKRGGTTTTNERASDMKSISGDMTVIALSGAEVEILSLMLSQLYEFLGDGDGMPARWRALVQDWGLMTATIDSEQTKGDMT
jgi:hypothetical protein